MCSEVRHEEITVSAIPGHGPDEEQEVSYKDVKVIGKGTFGVVYRARLCETGQMVAIKKVFHNEKFKVSYVRHSSVIYTIIFASLFWLIWLSYSQKQYKCCPCSSGC